MRYKFTGHAIDQMQERGVSENEVTQTIEAGRPALVRGSRSGRQRVFTEGYSWLGRDYPHKEVRAVYALEGDSLIVITIIARYGRWEGA